MTAPIKRAADYGAGVLLEPELKGIAERLGRLAGAPPGPGAYGLGLDLARHIVRAAAFEGWTSRQWVKGSADVAEFFRPLFAGLAREEFHVVFLDPKNAILSTRCLFVGTVDSSAVYPREIIMAAYAQGASALVFVHNHPSGDPEPSECDRLITKALVNAAKVCQLKVLDHIVVGGKGGQPSYSFADHGLIEDYQLQAITAGL